MELIRVALTVRGRRERGALCGVGAERADCVRWWAISTTGIRGATHAAAHAGVWEIFIPGAKEGDSYKYFVRSRHQGYQQLKADPFARADARCLRSPRRWCAISSGYEWNDGAWMEKRAQAKCCASRFRFTKCTWNRGCAGPAGQPLTYRGDGASSWWSM